MWYEGMGQEFFQQRGGIVISQVKQMSRIVKGKAILFIGTAQPANLPFFFINLIVFASQMVSSAQASKTSTNDKDHKKNLPIRCTLESHINLFKKISCEERHGY